MFPLYLQYLLIDFRQMFVTGASWDTDALITFLGQKIKVQGHTITAEAHSTRRYRRVRLFLVVLQYQLMFLELLQIPYSGPVRVQYKAIDDKLTKRLIKKINEMGSVERQTVCVKFSMHRFYLLM